MNDWRVLKERPGKAHLWRPVHGCTWRSKCGRVQTVDVFKSTYPAPVENGLTLKCKHCIPYEMRSAQQKTASRRFLVNTKPALSVIRGDAT